WTAAARHTPRSALPQLSRSSPAKAGLDHRRVTPRPRAGLSTCCPPFLHDPRNGGPIMDCPTSNLDRSTPAPWEAEAVERQVLAITCRHYELDPRRVCPDDRLGVEITGDSLDVVEYVME